MISFIISYYPDFNPNNKDLNENNLINRVIQSNYEMITFKPFNSQWI